VANDTQSIPAYATFAVQSQANHTWVAGTTDVRALQTGANTSRIAACWYNYTPFSFDVNFTDGNTHQFGLYLLDWDSQSRMETIQVRDAATNALLNGQTISNFSGGLYLIWNISGHVKITITLVSGPNAVVSGAFFN
jgi:hypothetical protein